MNLTKKSPLRIKSIDSMDLILYRLAEQREMTLQVDSLAIFGSPRTRRRVKKAGARASFLAMPIN
jgi:hypothetical protein